VKRRKLIIISHTQHFKSNDGVIMGWGPTINEVNFLANYWEEVIHIACFHSSTMPLSSLPYTKNNIHFIPIPPYGGNTIKDKFSIFFKIPGIIATILKAIKGASEVQLRLPTSMGLFLLPLFSFFVSRKFILWVKYAGNWGQRNPPLSYRLQRWWLNKNIANCKVTINGFWEGQPKHCLSFENPCLSLDDINNGKEISDSKTFNSPYVLTFVGRLESSKGIDRIITALKVIPPEKIHEIHFIGDGNNKLLYEKETLFLQDKITYHGFLDKKGVHDILARSHFLLLPSDSEGFPKVVAEAACYGTIPVVSDAGSISHYVNETNGFVWNLNSKISYSEILGRAINRNDLFLKEKSRKIQLVAKRFTFVNYIDKLESAIFTLRPHYEKKLHNK
jgi:glycosyltransferase involved in cell wall biosynthesis